MMPVVVAVPVVVMVVVMVAMTKSIMDMNLALTFYNLKNNLHTVSTAEEM